MWANLISNHTGSATRAHWQYRRPPKRSAAAVVRFSFQVTPSRSDRQSAARQSTAVSHRSGAVSREHSSESSAHFQPERSSQGYCLFPSVTAVDPEICPNNSDGERRRLATHILWVDHHVGAIGQVLRHLITRLARSEFHPCKVRQLARPSGPPVLPFEIPLQPLIPLSMSQADTTA
jgi:hypothetical protein